MRRILKLKVAKGSVRFRFFVTLNLRNARSKENLQHLRIKKKKITLYLNIFDSAGQYDFLDQHS